MVLIAFTVTFAALAAGSLTRTSATWDEPGHLAAGYAALVRGDYRLDIEHTPLLRMWAALPMAATSTITLPTGALDDTTPEALAFGGPFEAGHRFLYKDNDADRLLYRARFMIVVLGIGLGVLLFCWAGEWLGFRAAVLALALYTLEPNLAAHASLATTDLGVTAFMFAAVYFLWRTCRHWSRWNIAGLTIAAILALLGKFSAIMLAPIIALLMLFAALHGAFTFAAGARIIALLIASAWLGVWAAYGFRYAPSPSPGWIFSLHEHPAVRQAVPVWAALVGWVDAHHWLPNAFTQGFLHGQWLVQGRPAFLVGSYSNFGWWYYFPVAFLVKTPLALLVLSVAGVAVSISRRRLFSLDGEAFVIVPIVIFGAVAMTSTLNIGLRHILPIYPFVVLLGVIGAHRLAGAGSKARWIVLGGLLSAGLFEFGRVYPDNLAFFNTAAGGPHNGFRYLADSNVDWGQGLKPLKAWMDRHSVAHVNLAYFGTADPAYYGINCTYIWGTTVPGLGPSSMGPPRLPGYVATSVTLLNGVPFGERDRDFYKPLRDREPVAHIGGSIRVYWVERPWW
jgi:hypothetical protein